MKDPTKKVLKGCIFAKADPFIRAFCKREKLRKRLLRKLVQADLKE